MKYLLAQRIMEEGLIEPWWKDTGIGGDEVVRAEKATRYTEQTLTVVKKQRWFEVSPAQEMYRAHRHEYTGKSISEMHRLRPIAPPYSSFWMEASGRDDTAGVAVVCVDVDKHHLRMSDLLRGLFTKNNVSPESLRWIIQMHLVYWDRTTATHRLSIWGMGIVLIDRTGLPIYGETYPVFKWDAAKKKDLIVFITERTTPFLEAMKLLSCRNISTDTIAIEGRHGRRLERAGGKREGGYRYHVLTVNVGTERAPRYVPLAETMRNVPLHTVRGHYVTYTPERPLFGKYAGTFYRSPHLRGLEANGVVEKDYAMQVGNEQDGATE